MKYTPIPANFKYPELTPEHYRFGAGQIVGTVLREDMDWRPYLSPEEDQNIRGIESSACYIEAQQHSIATLEEEMFRETDNNNNYSSRFNALLSDGSEGGGDPLKGADSIRHDGLIPDSMMPFGDEIQSWDDFHSWKGVNEKYLREEGKRDASKKDRSYDIIFERNEPVERKYAKLRQALKFCPPPVSVTAWYQDEETGLYIKPELTDDNHLVELTYIDEQNRGYVRDTYSPYLKILAPNFNFDFGLRWTVKKKAQEEESFFTKILAVIKEFFQIIFARRY